MPKTNQLKNWDTNIMGQPITQSKDTLSKLLDHLPLKANMVYSTIPSQWFVEECKGLEVSLQKIKLFCAGFTNKKPAKRYYRCYRIQQIVKTDDCLIIFNSREYQNKEEAIQDCHRLNQIEIQIISN
jgi:hypothetical protein